MLAILLREAYCYNMAPSSQSKVLYVLNVTFEQAQEAAIAQSV